MNSTRRELLLSIAGLLVCPVLLKEKSQDQVWKPVIPNLVAGQIFDLNQTLPFHIKPGGQFSLSPQSLPLPRGLVLSPQGQLIALPGAQEIKTSGLVFDYSIV
jgi:hypothetical protein